MTHPDSAYRVGLAIPTLNAGSRWADCLGSINRQSFLPQRLLVLDSESTDETASLAKSAGFEVLRIERSQFNHGGTRQQAVEHLSDCEIVIFLTQDAILADEGSFAQIVSCFDDPRVALAYGRQVPHVGATAIESHARVFNYGAQSLEKNAQSIAQFGTKVFFCSNSFAAYRRKLLMDLGGFRRDLILGEDMDLAARAISAGYTNRYCAGAVVYHSHDYTIEQTLSRYFDIGVFDASNAWLREQFGSHSGEGRRFVISELRYLAKRAPAMIPIAVLQTAAKFIGYKLGRSERLLPISLKKKMSTMPAYWAVRKGTN
jgi:rhamnosyltransferase